jgi:hypothetical protein
MQQSRFNPAATIFVVFAMAVAFMLAGCQREPAQQGGKSGPNAQVELPVPTPEQRAPPDLPPLFSDIEKRTFQFFWETTNARNGLAPDRHPSRPFASIAAVGFALTAYPIGVENGWISRAQAAERTLTTLKFFHEAKQGPQERGTSGYKGFFYHFLDMDSGLRWNQGVELSTVDTTLLLGGVLFAQSYYDGDDPREREIRDLADAIYRRVDWTWAQNNKPLVSMGWHPERGFIPSDWRGYNEAMLLYVLALGSPTHPVGPEAWEAWTSTYDKDWGEFQGQEYLSFAPHFGHQYSHVWIDFRGIRDAYMRDRGIDYFENSRRATYAQRAYAIENPMGWKGYGEDVWGLTACDGPAGTTQPYKGERRQFRQYSARGAGLSDVFDDGTIAPTAAVASLPFAPEIVIPATEAMHERYGEYLYSEYGFLDSFNPSFDYDVPSKSGRNLPGGGWVASDYLGIDQGPIVAMIANYRNDFVWNVMKRNPYIRAGLERAGFTGGWLAEAGKPKASSGPSDPEAAAVQATGTARSRAVEEEPSASPPPDASEPPM